MHRVHVSLSTVHGEPTHRPPVSLSTINGGLCEGFKGSLSTIYGEPKCRCLEGQIEGRSLLLCFVGNYRTTSKIRFMSHSDKCFMEKSPSYIIFLCRSFFFFFPLELCWLASRESLFSIEQKPAVAHVSHNLKLFCRAAILYICHVSIFRSFKSTSSKQSDNNNLSLSLKICPHF